MPFVQGETLRARLGREQTAAGGGRDHAGHRGRRCPGLRPRERRRPPRHQAREHPAEWRSRRGGGLRRGQGARDRPAPRGATCRRPVRADPGRLRHRHAELHGARAGHRTGRSGRPGGPVQPRLRALRDARRRPPVRRRNRAVGDRAQHDGAAPARGQGPARGARPARGRHHPRDGDRSGGSLLRHGGPRGRAAPVARECAAAAEDRDGGDRGGRHRRRARRARSPGSPPGPRPSR